MLLVLFVLVIWGSVNYYQGSINLVRDSNDNSRISFEINDGDDFKTVIDKLAHAKLVYSPLSLRLYGLLHGDVTLKPGKYVLRRDLTGLQILDILSGQTVLEKWLTIPDGWRMTQIAERVEALGLMSKEDFLSYTKSANALSSVILDRFPFLKDIPSGQGLEGYLFPDSYILPPNPHPTDIINRAVQNLKDKIGPEIMDIINTRGIKLHSLLIMASIIEREATDERDRQLISDILWRRLANGIPLGADPTVLYALGSWEVPLNNENLKIDSPYNTRKFAGLPPGPIGTSSLSSIIAAAKPKPNDYWYFLAESETGTIHYSRMLEEHNQKKVRYVR